MAKLNPWVAAALSVGGGALGRYQQLRDEDREAQKKERDQQLQFIRQQAMKSMEQQRAQDAADETYDRNLVTTQFGNLLNQDPAAAGQFAQEAASRNVISPDIAELFGITANTYKTAQDNRTGSFAPKVDLEAQRKAEAEETEQALRRQLMKHVSNLIDSEEYKAALTLTANDSAAQRLANELIELDKENRKTLKQQEKEQQRDQRVESWIRTSNEVQRDQAGYVSVRQQAIDLGIQDDPRVNAFLKDAVQWGTEYFDTAGEDQYEKQRVQEYLQTPQGSDVRERVESLRQPDEFGRQIPGNSELAQATIDSALAADNVSIDRRPTTNQYMARQPARLFDQNSNLTPEQYQMAVERVGGVPKPEDYISASLAEPGEPKSIVPTEPSVAPRPARSDSTLTPSAPSVGAGQYGPKTQEALRELAKRGISGQAALKWLTDRDWNNFKE